VFTFRSVMFSLLSFDAKRPSLVFTFRSVMFSLLSFDAKRPCKLSDMLSLYHFSFI
jgi:hypothetical protein